MRIKTNELRSKTNSAASHRNSYPAINSNRHKSSKQTASRKPDATQRAHLSERGSFCCGGGAQIAGLPSASHQSVVVVVAAGCLWRHPFNWIAGPHYKSHGPITLGSADLLKAAEPIPLNRGNGAHGAAYVTPFALRPPSGSTGGAHQQVWVA